MSASIDDQVSDVVTIEEIAAAPRQWVSFTDGDGDTWMFDLSFLTSNWTCVYGQGCPGIGETPEPESAIGCCAHGAHFVDANDENSTQTFADRLDQTNWQHRPSDLTNAFRTTNGARATATVDGACIFLNRPGFVGGVGCALHIGALAAGERPLGWKPDVCWQVPIRFDEHVDDNGHRTWMLRAWERRDWGGGGDEFHSWCTEEPGAFVDHEMVVHGLRDEIIELVGIDAYAILMMHLGTLDLQTIAPQEGSVAVELLARR